MSKVERIEFPETPSDADVQTFHDDTQRTADLNDAMRGDDNRYQDGGQHDLQPRGITSVDYEVEEAALREASAFQEANYPQPQPATFVQDQPQEVENVNVPQESDPASIEHWRKLYGQSENEKGELRRALQEQMEAHQQLMAQMQQTQQFPQQVQPQVDPYYGYNQPVMQPQVPQYQPQWPTPQPPANGDFTLINGKQDDEMVLAGEVNEAFRKEVIPYVAQMNQQMQGLYSALEQERLARVNDQKVRLGITPQVEQQIVATNPWVNSIADPMARLNAIVNLKRAAEAQAMLRRATPAQQATSAQPQAPNPAQAAVQRNTFVERGTNKVSASDSPQVAREQQFAKEMAAIREQFPYGDPRRGTAERALLTKYGIGQVSGYRDPSISTR